MKVTRPPTRRHRRPGSTILQKALAKAYRKLGKLKRRRSANRLIERRIVKLEASRKREVEAMEKWEEENSRKSEKCL